MQPEQPVHKVLQVKLVQPVQLALQAHKELLAILDQQDQLEPQAQLVQLVRRALQAMLAQQVLQVHKGYREM